MYSSETLNELSNYQCELGYIDEKYTFISKIPELIEYVFTEFDSCVEPMIILKLKRTINKSFIYLNTLRLSKKCTQTSQIHIYPIEIAFEGKTISHLTYIIVNLTRHEIEYYEPHGSDAKWHSTVEPQLRNMFEFEFPTFQFVSTVDFCPPTGPQRVAKKGWCFLFSLLYVLIRLKEPQLTRHQCIVDLLKGGKDQIRLIMSKFVCFSYDLIVSSKIYEFLIVRKHIRSQVYEDFIPSLETLYVYLQGSVLNPNDKRKILALLDRVITNITRPYRFIMANPNFSDYLYSLQMVDMFNVQIDSIFEETNLVNLYLKLLRLLKTIDAVFPNP